jgi:hypothetical protein
MTGKRNNNKVVISGKKEHDQGRLCRNCTMCLHIGDEIKYNLNQSQMTSELHVEASQGPLKYWKHLNDSLAALELLKCGIT